MVNPEQQQPIGYFFDDDVDFDDLGKGVKKINYAQKLYEAKQKQVEEEIRKKWEAEQNAMKANLIMDDQFAGDLCKDNLKENLRFIGAADISFNKQDSKKCVAALIICEFPSLKVVYEDYETDTDLDQPYIPGFLAFREIPVYDPLFKRLASNRPDLWPQILMVDGNGILHTRGFGLACQLGVIYDIPTIGCAKTPFAVDGLTKMNIKEQVEKNCSKGGDYTLLVGDSGRTWGAALRATDESSQPMYISIGHRISLETAIDVVNLTLDKFRIPEPIRQADLRGRAKIREAEKGIKKI